MSVKRSEKDVEAKSVQGRSDTESKELDNTNLVSEPISWFWYGAMSLYFGADSSDILSSFCFHFFINFELCTITVL